MVIDACMLGGSDSTFLQQATHLTGGVYLRPKYRSALLQYLLVRAFTQTLALQGVNVLQGSGFCCMSQYDSSGPLCLGWIAEAMFRVPMTPSSTLFDGI